MFNTVTANRQSALAREAVAHVAGRVLVPVDTSLGSDRFPALCRAVDAALVRSASVSLREPDRYAKSLDEASAELGRSAHNPYMVNIRPVAPGTLIRSRPGRAQEIERSMASSRYGRFPNPSTRTPDRSTSMCGVCARRPESVWGRMRRRSTRRISNTYCCPSRAGWSGPRSAGTPHGAAPSPACDLCGNEALGSLEFSWRPQGRERTKPAGELALRRQFQMLALRTPRGVRCDRAR